ncbi:MAG: hypothetical protein M0Z49_17020 [Chloroflexi bacterium]|nr:hypothetical protein [Chloroflexota bacterium]
MSLESIGHGSWRCEPALAAFLVSRVVWAAKADLLIHDLERNNPIAKRLQIASDTHVILEVHCMLNGAQDTSVDFLLLRGLTRVECGLGRRLVAGALELAVVERLVQRPVGFRQQDATTCGGG